MRIDCEQCGAAFSIDDSLISERGVRAQCPKCGHQKVVKKPAAAAAPNPFAPSGGGVAAAAPSPFGATNPFSAGGDGSTIPAGNPFAAPSAPSGAPTVPSGNPFASQPTVMDPFSGMAPPAGANPFAGAPQPVSGASAPSPFGASPFGAPSSPPAPSPFGAPSSPPAPSPFAAAPSPFAALGAAPAPSPFGASSPPAPSPFGGGASSPFVPATNPPAPSGADPFASFGAASSPPSSGPDASPFGLPPISTSPPAAAGNPFGAPPSPSSGGTSPGTPAISFIPANAPLPSGGAAPKGDPFAALAKDPVRPGLAAPAYAQQPSTEPLRPPPGEASDPFAKLDLGGPGSGGGSFDAIARTSGGSAKWHVRTKGGMDAEVDLAQLKDMIRRGEVGPNDEAGPLDGQMKPVGAQPMLLPPVVPKAGSGPRVAGARASGGGGIPRAAWLLIPVALIAGGVALFIAKPELFESQTDAGPNPLRRAKATWARQFPDVAGTAADHLAAGKAQMKLDTAAGYRKADEELRQALLLDIGNVQAMSLWVENFANLPAVRSDLEGGALANEAITYAAKKEPTSGDVMRAQGALKLAHGDVDGAQKALDAARAKNPADTAALLLLAKTHLERNPQDALNLLESEIKAKDPDLKHALVVEGAAQRRLGDFKAARDALNARLTSDPQNTGALKEMAKLELDVGNPEEAIGALTRLIGAEERDVDAHLMRAKIAYQALKGTEGLQRAAGFLDEVLAKHESSAGELLLPVLSHAAYVKAELGELDKAQALAERARATDGNFAPALFVLGRVQSLKGDVDGAKKSLEQAVRAAQARDSFYEPIVRAELAAVQAKSGDAQNAIRNFEQVIEYDPRYSRAHFGLAATYMQTEKATQAMTIMRRALQNDPAQQRERPALTDYPTAARDLVALADIFKAAQAPANDPSLGALKLAGEGVIRYHAGQVAEAKRLFEATLREDNFNHAAMLYLGVIASDEGLPAEAKRRLRAALDTTGKGHHITELYMARAELATGDVDLARKRLQDLLTEEPTLVQAQYTLAMVLKKQGLSAQAGEELKKVVRQDPDFTPAKRALVE